MKTSGTSTKQPSSASPPSNLTRAPPPFIQFSVDKREEMQAAHPDKTFTEITRMISRRWRKLPAREKQVLPAVRSAHCAQALHSHACPGVY
jgi:hypothetical protein